MTPLPLHGEPVSVADQAFLFKTAAREIALQHGLNTVFMAKPIAGQAGSSMHLHRSVVNAQGLNVFSQADGSASEAFFSLPRGFAGRHARSDAGLRAHRQQLRSVDGSQAPTHVHWGYDNRTAGLRVPVSAPVARQVENRLAGADANPYLAMAATLATGPAGIAERLQPSAAVEGNGYDLARGLPRTFDTAHAQMMDSVHAPRPRGEHFVQGFLAVKALEHDHFLNEISAWERRYLLPHV